MIRKFILPDRIFLNSDFYEKSVHGKTDKYQSVFVMVGKYLTHEHINWASIRQGSVPSCFYVEIVISDDSSIKLLKDKGFILVEKSPCEAQSDFDYTAEKYSKEILNKK